MSQEGKRREGGAQDENEKEQTETETETEGMTKNDEPCLPLDDHDHDDDVRRKRSTRISFREQLELQTPPKHLSEVLNRTRKRQSTTADHSPPPFPWVVGHRGALYDELENTLDSFQRCSDWGCDAIELDVFRLPGDGTLVCFHGGGTDANPGDLTDYCIPIHHNHYDHNTPAAAAAAAAGPPWTNIMDCRTYHDVQTFVRFNPDFAEFPCRPPDKIRRGRIPTLRTVLETVIRPNPNMVVKIELKGPDTTRSVLELVEELDLVRQCHFSSFNHDRIALIRQLHPETGSSPPSSTTATDTTTTTTKELERTSSQQTRGHSIDTATKEQTTIHRDKAIPPRRRQQQQQHHNDYHYKTAALFDELPPDYIERATRVGASEIHLRYDTCTPTVIRSIHDAGMGSMAWFRGPRGMRHDLTAKYACDGRSRRRRENEDDEHAEANETDMYAAVLETGVEQICVNRPDVLMEMLGRSDRRSSSRHRRR